MHRIVTSTSEETRRRVKPVPTLAEDLLSLTPDFVEKASPTVDQLTAALLSSTPTPTLTPRRDFSDRARSTVLVASDLVATFIAVPIALVILSQISTQQLNSLKHFSHNLSNVGFLPITVVLCLAIAGLYRSARHALHPSTFTEMKDIAFAVGAGGILLLALGAVGHSISKAASMNPTQVLMAIVIATLFVVIGRALVRAWVNSFTITRVLVVGSGPLVKRISTYLRMHIGMEMVGHVVDGDLPYSGAIGTVRDLPDLCEKLEVDRIIVAFPDRMTEHSRAVLRDLQERRLNIAVIPRYFELTAARSRLTELSGLPLIELAPPHLSTWDRGVKRTIDILLALFGLLVTSPIMLALAIAIRFNSPGPIIFRQDRIGRNQKPFTIYKFRTMRCLPIGEHPSNVVPIADKEEGYDYQPLVDIRKKRDERHRITSVGAFLRTTALDELPQFFNVLKGDMSIVGPRPFVPNECELDGWAVRRFEVRPGITGLWQVSGRNELSTEDLRQLDYLYVASWSLSWDLKILWDTPRTMIRGLGAY
jgi:exopolysaccharide biosynthesis polyprenyl glycosylphosphotransferase